MPQVYFYTTAYLLVIIQYGVHVLDPDSIHRTIKHDPLPVLCGTGGMVPESVR